MILREATGAETEEKEKTEEKKEKKVKKVKIKKSEDLANSDAKKILESVNEMKELLISIS